MKIYHGFDEYERARNPVVTVGTFDGVHLGHRKIFEYMTKLAHSCNGQTVVITFDPHPRLVLHADSRDLKFINTRERKYELIAAYGIDQLMVIPFTREFAGTGAEQFVENILVEKIGLSKLVVGYDHHFGRNREGSYDALLKMAGVMGFELERVPARDINQVAVSSTKIRNALNEGRIRLANELLGYEYSITGKVIPGNKIGRGLGFPTANIRLDDVYKLITAVGVYACRIKYRNRLFSGMGNIGYRPTVNHGDLTIEVHIFNFNEEIYDETLTIFFVDRIRDEIKFDSLEDLRDQLVKDRETVCRILGC